MWLAIILKLYHNAKGQKNVFVYMSRNMTDGSYWMIHIFSRCILLFMSDFMGIPHNSNIHLNLFFIANYNGCGLVYL